MATKKPSVETATPASDKKKAIETCMAQIERAYGKGSIMRLGENSNKVKELSLIEKQSNFTTEGTEYLFKFIPQHHRYLRFLRSNRGTHLPR